MMKYFKNILKNSSLTHSIYVNINYVYLKYQRRKEKVFGLVFRMNSEEIKSKKEKCFMY